MKNLLRSLAFLLLVGIACAQSNLPACQGSDVSRWSNCVGSNTFASGNKYVGEHKDGKPNGQGTYTFTNGSIYVGEYKDGRRNGQFTVTFSCNKYVGVYKDDKIDGQGTYTFANGNKFVGEFEDPNSSERDRLTAEVDAERRKRQELEGQLSVAQLQSIKPSASFGSERRVALVIGNATYKNSPLKNPVNDARDMAVKLRGLGFTVIERNNLVVKQIGSTLREFRSKLTPGSVALVYYAGHGLQIKGDNYFPTVDADITGEEDVPNQSLAMKQIMDVLGDAKTRLNLVFLDACRDNPYSRSFRSASKGLSKENAPSGTLISFATRPGSVAADGVGRNGLYTGALLEAMDNRGQPIEQVLKRVVTSVKAGSGNQQEPWMEGSIEGDFCFGNCNSSQVASASPSAPNLSEAQKEEKFWDDAKGAGNKDAFEAYLSLYPSGRYVGLAKANLAKLVPPAPITQPLLSPRDVLAGAYVGTWSPEQCGSRNTYVYRLENESLLGEFRGNGNLIATYIIRLDTVKYLGSFNGMHRVAYRSTSEAVSNKVQTVNDVTVETNFKIRRTLDSTRGNVQQIKDGVVLSSNQKVVDIVKCN